MEMPLSCDSKKRTRRKLRKVLKKAGGNLNLSTHNLMYQRRLKSAISVSLNSSRNVRTLQANNRSLACSLEKLRQDFRHVHDHNTLLLETNHELRERILELERLAYATTKYVEEEVNRRCEEHTRILKEKLKSLNSHAMGFLDTVTEMLEICTPTKECAVEDISLPGCVVTTPSSPRLSDTGLMQGEIGKDVENISEDETVGQVHQMSLIMEQSVLYPSPKHHISASGSLSAVSEYDPATSSSTEMLTKLPVRVLKENREPRKKSAQNLSERFNADSANNQIKRRETFTVTSDKPVDTALITDVVMPHLLGSDYQDQPAKCQDGSDGEISQRLELQGTVQQSHNTEISPCRSAKVTKKVKRQSAYEQITTLSSPRRSSERYGKENPCHDHRQSPRNSGEKNKRKSSSQSPSHGFTISPGIGRKCSPVKGQKNSPSNGSMFQLKARREKGGSMLPCSKRIIQKHSGKAVKKGNGMSIISSTKKDQTLYISNEFDLTNAHLQRIENRSKAEDAVKDYQSPHSQTLEHTLLMSDDMELTECVSVPIEIMPQQSRMNSKGRVKHTEQPIGDGIDSSQEILPDAVTMRFAKPGQFIFAASRKESDGTRKTVPVSAPKARSKSKKQVTEILPQQSEPRSVFDFHDKTPTAVNEGKKVAMSVFSISADESILSPVLPLSRTRSQSKDDASINSRKEQRSRSCLESKENAVTLLGDGLTYEEQLKESPLGLQSKYRTRSQSGSRKKQSANGSDTMARACSFGANGGDETQPGSPAWVKTTSLPLARSRNRSAKKAPDSGVDLVQLPAGDSDICGPENSAWNKRTSLPSARSKGRFTKKASDNGVELVQVPLGDSDSSGRGCTEDFSDKKSNQVECQGEKMLTCFDLKNTEEAQKNAVFQYKKVRDLGISLSPVGKKHCLEKRIERSTKNSLSIKYQKQEDVCPLSGHALTGMSRALKDEEDHIHSSSRSKNKIAVKKSEEYDSPGQVAIESLKANSELSSANEELTGVASSALVGDSVEADNRIKDSKDFYIVRGTIPDETATCILENFSTAIGEKSNLTYVSEIASNPHKSSSKESAGSTILLSRKRKQRCRPTSREGKTNEICHAATPADQTDSPSVSQLLDANRSNKTSEHEESCEEIQKRKNRSRSRNKHKMQKSPQSDGRACGGGTVENDMDDFEKESHHLLKKLKEQSLIGAFETTCAEAESLPQSQSSTQGPKVSRILKVNTFSYHSRVSGQETSEISIKTSASPAKRCPSPEICESSFAPEGKKRRAATKVNYTELPLNVKLRRGDPFTSHYCTTDRIDIFKSHESKAKKKAQQRRDALGPLQNLTIKEDL